MNEMNDFESLIGFSSEKVDAELLKQLIVNSFVYHEKMADVSINTINKHDNEGLTVSNKSALWASFETNNMISFALRDALTKAAGIKLN